MYRLIPIRTFLALLGIKKFTNEELHLQGFNEFFPKVNVQYKKFNVELETRQTRIMNLNGENIQISDPGPHRIKLI